MQIGLLLLVLSAAAQKEPGIFQKLAAAGEDFLGRAVNDFGGCDCGCCVATERLDQELERSADGRLLLTHKCVHPNPSTEECPTECVARDRKHKLEEDQFVEPGSALDYARYCFHNCIPAVMINGGQCMQSSALAGNATGDGLKKLSDEKPLLREEAEADAKVKAAAQAKAKAEAQADAAAEEEVKQVTWDLRGIRAQRAAAERAAAEARAAYSAGRTKLHTLELARATKMLDRVKKAVSEEAKSYEPHLMSAQANATAAGDSAVEVYNVFKKAKAQLRKVGATTRQLAEKLIPEAAAAAAKSEAASYVARMHFGEPGFRRQAADAAALPYVTAVATGAQRAAQYRHAAEAAELDAREAQVDMDAAEKEAEALAKSGERVAVGMKKREAAALRHKAQDAEASAARSRATAEKALESAAAWQKAAQEVVEHSAYMYDLSVAKSSTLPPIVALPPPAAV
ncbi:unnamed protein product [Effrenium voratum]|uniref:Uncharacterized protein n=1 Tax=Effrenium voratum TaxID=2562239 RepID=A0AA36NED0_9DINO|nr:unnamed protein product [Effrenium voratum]CAJ1421987.1 unnamed protein product [Effrenium voratum]